MSLAPPQPHELLGLPSFWALYFQQWLPILEGDNPTAKLEDIFGPPDHELTQRLFPRLRPTDHVIDDDLLLATRRFPNFQELDSGLRDSVLRQLAVRRLYPECQRIDLHLPGDYVWQIEFDPCPGIYHSLLHPSFDEPLLLGADDAHFQLPILRWNEVDCLRRYLLAHQRPLLHTIFWRTSVDDPAVIRAALKQDWTESAVLMPGNIGKLLDAIDWVSDLKWRDDPTRGWINDGDHSLRNPDDSEWNAIHGFEKFQEFLDTIGAA